MNFSTAFRVLCVFYLTLPFLLSAADANNDWVGPSGILIESKLPDMLLGLDRQNEVWRERQAEAPRSVVPQWHAFKKRIEERYRLSFDLAYSALYQRSSDTFEGNLAGTEELREIYDYLNLSPPAPGLQDDAFGGIAEFGGKWFITGPDRPDAGYIGFELENRHRLGTAVNPQALFIDNGSIWPTGTAYGEFDTALLSLYYEGFTSDNRIGIRTGKFLPFAVYDFFSLKNAKTSFNDFSFSLSPAIGWATWGMGVTAYVKPTSQTYINFGVHDLNGGPRKGIKSFFEEREYFSVVDAGYNTRFDFGNGNIHAMYWHTDKRKQTGTPSAQGITIAGEQAFGRVLPFLRYAYQDGEVALIKNFYSGGIGFREVFGRKQDVIGIGLGYGEPVNKELFATDQKSVETYYRMFLSKEFSVTAGITYIKDPPLNLTEDELTVVSFRGRAQF